MSKLLKGKPYWLCPIKTSWNSGIFISRLYFQHLVRYRVLGHQTVNRWDLLRFRCKSDITFKSSVDLSNCCSSWPVLNVSFYQENLYRFFTIRLLDGRLLWKWPVDWLHRLLSESLNACFYADLMVLAILSSLEVANLLSHIKV